MKPFRLWIYWLFTCWLPETHCFGWKVLLLRWAGANIGKNVRVNSSARFIGNGKLEICEDVWIGAGCRILPVGAAEIKIGAHCDFGPEVMIITGSHAIASDGEHVAGKGTVADVTVGAGSWIGARAVIMPGVTLAPRTLVAAGAVVTSCTVEEKTLIAGVPAVEKKRF